MNTPIKLPENTQLNYDIMSRQELINICREQAKLLEEMSRNIKWMMEQIKLSNKNRFGSSSDSAAYPEGYEQPSFFNEAEALANPGAAARHNPSRPVGIVSGSYPHTMGNNSDNSEN